MRVSTHLIIGIFLTVFLISTSSAQMAPDEIKARRLDHSSESKDDLLRIIEKQQKLIDALQTRLKELEEKEKASEQKSPSK